MKSEDFKIKALKLSFLKYIEKPNVPSDVISKGERKEKG